MQYIGKNDGETSINNRYYKRVRCAELEISKDFCSVEYNLHEAPFCNIGADELINVGVIGFASDIGAKRNAYTLGAAKGCDYIRSGLMNFSAQASVAFKDYGDIKALEAKAIGCTDHRMPQNPSSPGYMAEGCMDASLENADYALFLASSEILKNDEKLLVLGGGAESAFAPICAVANQLPEHSNLGIISLSSLLGVKSQAEHTNANSIALAAAYARSQGHSVKYLCAGANLHANTQAVWRSLEAMSANYISDVNFELGEFSQLEAIINHSDALYLNLNLNVLADFEATSQPTPLGVSMIRLTQALKMIFASKKLLAADISEFAPELGYQADLRKASQLAAFLIEGLSGINIK